MDAILDILDNWQLSTSNLVAATTDSGSNIIAAYNILGLLRISCFGYNVGLAIKKALEQLTYNKLLVRVTLSSSCSTVVGRRIVF